MLTASEAAAAPLVLSGILLRLDRNLGERALAAFARAEHSDVSERGRNPDPR
jgi:hypothetical protein